MKLLVTGALGHIGSSVIRELPGYIDNLQMVMVDNMATQRYPSLFNLPQTARYQFIEADVSVDDLSELYRDVDAVLHCAAITNAAGSFANREQVERVNYDATVRVADACSQAQCRMIHLSSTSVYGTQKEVVDEMCGEEELKPQSPYAETKLREEAYMQSLSAANGLQYVILRFGTICGVSPGMRFHTAVNKFCWQAVLKQPITVWRTALHQKRPYLSLSDAVAAVAHVINENIFDKSIYNVLSGNHTVNDIVEFIRPHAPDLEIEFVDTEIMNQLSYEVLSERFASTGFDTNSSIKADVAATIGQFKQAMSLV